MDTKTLFDYEFQLESHRPNLTDEELLNTLKNPASISGESVEKVASFSLVSAEDGVYIKFADESGKQKKLMFINPIAAKSLAASLMQNLSAQGYIEDDILESSDFDTDTLH